MPTLKNVSPLGHIDVPLIGREGGPVAYYECPDGARCVERNGPDHEHELVEPEGSGPGQGCLVPGEVFDVSPEHAKRLLEHEDNFEAVGNDGPPSASWKKDALEEYAAAHDVDLTGATTKAEILAAIEKGL